MAHLSDITKEISRLKSLGKKPAMLRASPEVIEAIKEEYERVFFKRPERKMLGLELVATNEIQNGHFRIMVEW